MSYMETITKPFMDLGYSYEEALEYHKMSDWLYEGAFVELIDSDEELEVKDIDWANKLVTFENKKESFAIEQVCPSEKIYDSSIFSKFGLTYRVETDDFVAYGFETNKDVWVEEAWTECSIFIISKYKKEGGHMGVNVGYSEDYSYMEDVSYRFDLDEWWAFFENQKEEIPDHTEEYYEWVEGEE
jgi:hypothetical protein